MGVMGLFGLKEVPPPRRNFGITDRITNELVILDSGQTIRLLVVSPDRDATLISIGEEYTDKFGHRLDNLNMGDDNVWRIIENMAPFVWKMSIVRE